MAVRRFTYDKVNMMLSTFGLEVIIQGRRFREKEQFVWFIFFVSYQVKP